MQISNIFKINSNSIFKYDTLSLDYIRRNPEWRAIKNREKDEKLVRD
jgi:hypothetical protein